MNLMSYFKNGFVSSKLKENLFRNRTKWIYTAWLVVLVIILLLPQPHKYNDTDNITKHKKSGLTLYTDFGTGCQYIKSGVFGGLSPRYDLNGVQICIETSDLNGTD